MSLEVKRTNQLVTKDMRWKVLVIGRPGVGKTTWESTAPGLGVAACETGHGSGLLSVADRDFPFIEPRSLAEFEALCTGSVAGLKDCQTIALDSLTAMTRTFVKDYAVAMPAGARGNSPKRAAGIPELGDYQTMGETTRRLLSRLLEQDRNVIVTCLERADKDENGVVNSIGPDLPGMMSVAAPAMFDTVLFLKTRRRLANPLDKKSEYVERYFITQNDGMHVAKCRNVHNGKPLLAPEEVFDLKTGQGSWQYLYDKILAGYAEAVSAPLSAGVEKAKS
jgi:hypothetical protein